MFGAVYLTVGIDEIGNSDQRTTSWARCFLKYAQDIHETDVHS